MRIPFTQVDAFAAQAFEGNPAAVMPLSAWLDDATLLRIAQENNLSETAFLVPDASGSADYELRWFTPTAEIALCGHATLASGHVVLASDPDRARVRFATRQSGVLEVARDGAGYALALPALAPAPRDLPGVVAALGVTPAETLWRDGGYAVAVLADEAAVRACAPDQRALEQEGRLLVIVTAPGDTSDIVSRAFTPAFGIPEDPVTGSAHAVVVPYWAKRLGRDAFSAVQASARGGRLGCRLDNKRVVLSGTCVTTIEGTFLLP
ncbi:PhzF family phenazine biosynthesis protein [Sphingomonas endophytica]|uniref:PhzF superfamily epimerase YddE/YHI9 n=1 Tax=Sphingomonas endophytica TaxID=869719 RepID=A0ABR6N9M8_9SPHN|nr:PhzF family phenazine biosynthesis protein [Sphingomonas endophytica]MBB5727491.1 putative PhzF superfamily epimerase YddE/YHI9 [Sphingomonas endophytica]